jgi:hypothetical protein
MAANNEEHFTLHPSWKYFFFSYLLSFLAIPLIGAGLIALYYLRRERKSIRYIITNTCITAINEKYEHNVDLVDINRIETQQSWLQQKLDIGRLLLKTSASNMEIAGIEHPETLKAMLKQGIQSAMKRQHQQEKTKPRQPESESGNMEKLNYLTGLWQQGLISDEDYKEERKHFE